MATLNQFLQKSKSLNEKTIRRDIFKFIRTIEKEFIDKNKEQIFEDSTDIFEQSLGFYSKATELISGGRKKAGEPYDGRDTGDWLDGWYMQVVANVVSFRSSDPKNGAILQGEHWFTTEFFGLTDKNLNGIIEKSILPFLINNSKQILDI